MSINGRLTAEDVLTGKDVARLLHAPVSTVEDWARRGILPSVKIGRRRLYLRQEIEATLTRDNATLLVQRSHNGLSIGGVGDVSRRPGSSTNEAPGSSKLIRNEAIMSGAGPAKAHTRRPE
jgi:excisionase family DNA binding protein